MKVICTSRIENEYGFEETTMYEVKIENGSGIRLCNMGECPEDATLNRDLSGIYSVESMIREAYEAGKRGDELVFESVTSDE